MGMRIRTIKPEFWTNERVAALSPWSQLLAIALLNWADDHGYFLATPAVIRGALFPFHDNNENITVGLRELSRIDYVRLRTGSDGRSYGWIVAFSKHQVVNKPNKSKIEPLCDFIEIPVALPDVSVISTVALPCGRGRGRGREKELTAYRPSDSSTAVDQTQKKDSDENSVRSMAVPVRVRNRPPESNAVASVLHEPTSHLSAQGASAGTNLRNDTVHGNHTINPTVNRNEDSDGHETNTVATTRRPTNMPDAHNASAANLPQSGPLLCSVDHGTGQGGYSDTADSLTVSGPAAALPPEQDANEWTKPTAANAVIQTAPVATISETEPLTVAAVALNPHTVASHAFVLAWNELGQPFPKISEWSEKRRKSFKSRMCDPFFVKNWETAIPSMRDFPFLCGENDRGWVATPEFFLRPDSVTKITEGVYPKRPGLTQATAPPGNAPYRKSKEIEEMERKSGLKFEDFLKMDVPI